MKHLLPKIFLVAFLFLTQTIWAQLYPVSLDEKIDNSTAIVLGKVINQRSYRDNAGKIQTANLIQVIETYKGNAEKNIVITTKGGILDDEMTEWSHSLTLNNGNEGVFFLTDSHIDPIKDRNFEFPNYVVYSEEQGFIRFVLDFRTQAYKGVEPFNTYTDISGEVIEKIDTRLKKGPGGPKRIKDRTGVRYHFTHFSLNGNTLTFDIYANSLYGAKLLYQSGVVLSYNQTMFGSNLATNGNLRLREYGISALTPYDLSQANLLDNEVSIEMHASASNGLATITNTEQLLAKGELKIIAPVFDPKIHVNQNYLQSLNRWYDPTSGQGAPFDTVIVVIDAPASAAPVITSFSPTVVSAGTETIIEIKGENFENYVPNISSVYFTNAQSGPGSLFSTLEGDIVYWDPTTIRAVVPTAGKEAPGDPLTDLLIAGTGEIGVCNGSMLCSYSTDQLTVKYAIRNRFTSAAEQPNEVTIPVSLFGANDEKGFYLEYAANVNSDPAAKIAIQKALDTWKCATGVNYTTDPAHPNLSSSNVGTIAFGALGAGVLGITEISTKRCKDNASGLFVQGVLTSVEFTISNSVNWYKGADPAGIGATQHDLQSVCLHEFGHAHLHRHVNQSEQIMWFELGPNNVKRVLHPWDIEGGNWVMDLSTVSLTGTSCPELTKPMKKADTSGLPCGILLSTDDVVLGDLPLNVYPNPFENTLNISLDKLEGAMKVAVKLFDISGKLRFFSEEQVNANSITTLDLGALPEGLYFLNLVGDDGEIQTIKVYKL